MHKNLSNKPNRNEKGQSFLELSLVVVFLMIFVAGIVEFGFMLNNYLNMVDASREAVRFGASFDPFLRDASGNWLLDGSGNKIVDTDFYIELGNFTEQILDPVVIDPSKGDDIVITFFSVGSGIYIRYPNDDGWSVYDNHVSKLSNAEIQSRLDSSAPPTGVLLIEIFYNYPQVLKLPVFTAFVQDPMPVYAYAIMPLTAAEP
jgi:hypothetical protein